MRESERRQRWYTENEKMCADSTQRGNWAEICLPKNETWGRAGLPAEFKHITKRWKKKPTGVFSVTASEAKRRSWKSEQSLAPNPADREDGRRHVAQGSAAVEVGREASARNSPRSDPAQRGCRARIAREPRGRNGASVRESGRLRTQPEAGWFAPSEARHRLRDRQRTSTARESWKGLWRESQRERVFCYYKFKL